MSRHVTVVVSGVPVGQGNMKAYVVGGRAKVTHSNGSRLATWRRSIEDAVKRQLGEEPEMFTGPVKVSAAFRLPRPKSLPKRKRVWPIGQRSGDLDHYQRAIGDALTGVLLEDDARIVHWKDVTKDYANPGCQPGVVFTIWEVEE